ncbi:hypothetical protein [Moraxella lacunata]|uniref:hypothetical protein n=1 Tax=Moraxella lacunata TaxID=477 RepID=UPI003EE13C7F
MMARFKRCVVMVWTDGVCVIDFDIKNPKLYFLFSGDVLSRFSPRQIWCIYPRIRPRHCFKVLF